MSDNSDFEDGESELPVPEAPGVTPFSTPGPLPVWRNLVRLRHCHGDFTDAETLVLLQLDDIPGGVGSTDRPGEIWASNAVIAGRAGQDVRTVQRAVRKAKGLGLMVNKQHRDGMSRWRALPCSITEAQDQYRKHVDGIQERARGGSAAQNRAARQASVLKRSVATVPKPAREALPDPDVRVPRSRHPSRVAVEMEERRSVNRELAIEQNHHAELWMGSYLASKIVEDGAPAAWETFIRDNAARKVCRPLRDAVRIRLTAGYAPSILASAVADAVVATRRPDDGRVETWVACIAARLSEDTAEEMAS